MTSAPSSLPVALSFIVPSTGRTLGWRYRESYRAGTGPLPDSYQDGAAPNVYPRPDHPAAGRRMARPILRLATHFTRRTRATAWAIAFACMVLVGAMSLADGLANGVGSVANRIGTGPAVYIQGDELLASAIDSAALSIVPGDFVAMRAHAASLEINRLTLSVFVVALESYHAGSARSRSRRARATSPSMSD